MTSKVRPIVVLAAVALVAVVAVTGARKLAAWVGGLGGVTDVTAPADIVAGESVEVVIPAGVAARQIGSLLAEKGIVDSSLAFEAEVRRQGVADRLQAGTYRMVTGMGPAAALEVLLNGPEDASYRITLREGLWVSELLASLAEQTPYTLSEFETALDQVTSPYHNGEAADPQTWEGLLYPDTYEISESATPVQILQKLADTMTARVDSLDWSALQARGLSVYEGIIVASMVEAEAKVDDDRPLIASVIVNRLEIGMPLQIDATVLYALGERGKALTLDDLEIDSPYNTYRIGGLPPTPIGAPALRSLEAAAHPADSDFLYYVLTSADGRHSFAETYDEFLRLKAQAKADGVLP